MSKYHVNPNTMKPGVCKAQSAESCKFAQEDGTPTEHFGSIEDAQASAEKSLDGRYGSTETFKKTDRKTVENDKQYSGIRGSLPHTDGARIRIEDTGEILTISNKKPLNRLNYSVALDKDGNEVPRYVPGPEYSIIDGPNTSEFKYELSRIAAKQDVIAKRTAMEDITENIEKVVNSWIPANAKNLRLSQSQIYSDSGEHRPSFNVYGSNANGSKSFKHQITPNGVFIDGLTKSRTANSAADALKSIPFEKYAKLFEARESFDESCNKLREAEDMVEKDRKKGLPNG